MEKLEAGKYGVYTVEWDARTLLWIVSASTLRALKEVRVGRLVELSTGKKARVFGAGPKTERTLLRVLLKLDEKLCLIEQIKSDDLWDNIYGLDFGATEDGLIRLSGDILERYRGLVKFKTYRDPVLNTADSKRTCYLVPEKAMDILASLKAVEASIRDLLDIHLPEIEWCHVSQYPSGEVCVRGRLVVIQPDGEAYSNGCDVFPENAKAWISDYQAYAAQLKAYHGSAPMVPRAAAADKVIEGFQDVIEEDGKVRFEREDGWIFMNIPYTSSNPSLLNSWGWRWCYADNAWIAHLIKFDTESEVAVFLSRFAEAYRWS